MNKYLNMCTTVSVLQGEISALTLEQFDGVEMRLRRAHRVLQEQQRYMSKQATDHIAEQRGWKRSGRIYPRQLALQRGVRQESDVRDGWPSQLFDHPEFFKVGRKPTAIISHLYRLGQEVEIAREAAEIGLSVEFLPTSSYNPGRCLAVVLTPMGAENEQQ